MSAPKHTAGDSGCSNPECACVPYDGGPLSSERMPWQLAVADDGWPMVHNVGDVICVPDPNHHAGCAWDVARFRLIAAAPDLLEACADWIDWLKPDSPWRDDAADHEAKMLDAMRAAIAKATGETGQ